MLLGYTLALSIALALQMNCFGICCLQGQKSLKNNDQNSEFVTQQEIVCVSFLNKEPLHSCVQTPTDALMDLK